jgi:GNAT superfamily N-acetyltransferase
MTNQQFQVYAVKTEEDMREWCRVRNVLTPGEPIRYEEFLHEFQTQPDALNLLVRQEDTVVACAVAKASGSPTACYAMLRVLPEWQGQGVGSLLLAHVSDYARQIDRPHLQGRVTETDQAALAVLAHWGFSEVARECKVVLSLAEVEAPVVTLPDGVTLHALADRPDLIQGAYEVTAEARPDIPMPEPLDVPNFEDWAQSEIHAPYVSLAGSWVAVHEGVVIGYAGMADVGSGAGEHLLTGTRRAWRGRGIASALKNQQIAWAKAAGWAELTTYNEQGNESMRSINRKLGYQALPASLVMRGDVAVAQK